MAYELEGLLKIRLRREDTARGVLQKARLAVRCAENDLQARRDDLQRFEETKESRRDRIYDTIIGRSVKRDDLNLVREGVARIDKEGVLKADNVKRAEEELVKKEHEASDAKAAYIVTAKECSKISEHKSKWKIEEEKASEYRQDQELEEFTGKKVNYERDE